MPWCNGHRLERLVDSGATHSFVHSRVAATGGLKLEPASKLTVTLANGSLVSSVSRSFLCLEIPGGISEQPVVIEQHVRVLPDLTSDVILGMDWLQQNNPRIDWVDIKLCLGCGGQCCALDVSGDVDATAP